MQRGPDRNLVLKSRGLLEGQLKKVGAKFGSQGGCNSSVVVRAAHVLFIYRLGGGTWPVVLRPHSLPPGAAPNSQEVAGGFIHLNYC